jgi:3-oxoadipate enol-lactonase
MPGPILNHIERGRGVPVVLLHGFPFDGSIWRGQMDGMGKAVRVLAPDLPGFGGSGPLTGEEPTMDEYAERLALWARELDLGKLVLVGHSMGGYIAFAFARRYPGMLAGLGLVCTRPGPDTPQAREGRYSLANEAQKRGPQAVVDAMLARLFAPETREKQPEIVDQVREVMLRQRVEGITPALRAMASRPDSSATMEKIDVPTLVVSGSEDAIIPAEDSARMATTIRGARHVIVRGAGHMPMLERPGELTAALRSLAQAPRKQKRE